jgi:rSAM/selenodomain-associated transferase 1
VPRAILGLFAKAPVAGQVKTRMCPPLTPAQAARLYEAMLLDVIDQHARARAAELVLWHAPADAADWFEARVPPACRLLPQRGATLAARLAFAFRTHSGEGCERIVLRGTDSPTLPLGRVEAAFEALDRADLVLCPDLDGGYSLVGLRTACDPLFEVELGTDSVLEQTRKQADRLGLSCVLLPAHHDVDVIGDLERIRSELTRQLTPRTLDWLDALSLSSSGL